MGRARSTDFGLSIVIVSTRLPPVARVTPLRADQFAVELRYHPNQSRVSYVVEGLRQGFRLGFSTSAKLKAAKRNKPSAFQHARVIDDYLANEVSLGRVVGPFSVPPLRNLHVSSFGVIPKKGQPGKWRLIVDLSSPWGFSVNDGIDPEQFTLQYIRMDDVIRMVAELGSGALMAKFDVEAAYRNIPVHPVDRHLLGLKWRGQFFVDLTLPFGLRSAPFIFDSVATMVEWILINNYQVSALVHYLDDFVLAGLPDSPICAQNLSRALLVCRQLGLPLHPKKCEGPTTSMVVLGIHLDSTNQTARLPPEKLSALQSLITVWVSRQWCNRQQLESLIGHLHHAAKVVWPGRTFIRRMIDLLRCFRRRDHPVRLNREFRLDLEWWHQFLSEWHGVTFWLFPGMALDPDFEVTADAAGAIGYGAYFGNQWFNGSWFNCQRPLSIAYKELFPIVIAAHVWGIAWSKKHILFRSDNEAVVTILNSRTSKVPDIMHLVRHILMSAALFNFTFRAQHVPGVQNSVADALSRFNWQEFWRLAPSASPSPVPIPRQLLRDLTNQL